MDNPQLAVWIIAGLCLAFVLILLVMFRWNSALTRQVEALSAERSKLQELVTDFKQIISDLEVKNSELSAEVESLSQFSDIRNTSEVLKRLNETIARNDEEAKEQVRKFIADANYEANKITAQANLYAETLKREINADARANREKLKEAIDDANTHASFIISKAQKNAESIAGDAYRALKEADRLTGVIDALKNTINGYGDAYFGLSGQLFRYRPAI